jgi:hypothetical protein
MAVDLGSPLLSGPVGISTARAAPISVARSVLAECLRASVGPAAQRAAGRWQ